MDILDQLNPHINRKVLDLCSRKGNRIDNYQEFTFDKNEAMRNMLLWKKTYSSIIIRPDTVTSIYNCHGLTFASRRTGINTIDDKFLEEDDFFEINRNEAMPGDIVVYVNEKNEIDHSGVITFVQENENALFGSNITVLSKWGDGAEVIHDLYACDYPKANIKIFRCKSL